MSDIAWFENPLPHGLAKDTLEEWARRFAPRLLFHRNERHFPSSPESFRRNSRFRESRQGGRDRGWSRGSGWEMSNRKSERYYQVDWEVIEAETGAASRGFVGRHPSIRPTLRPHDGRNLYRLMGEGGSGLFLERDRPDARDSSGCHPLGGVITAPVFLDAAPVDTNLGSFVKVFYWFFYELNRWHGILTHEGDWEHVTYIVDLEGIGKLRPPARVYFAQHNSGELRRWSALQNFESGHPTMFVDQNGHPTKSKVRNPRDYGPRWETWTQEFRWIGEAPWRDYSGAWGEVGETKHTTGPLGPWFKQDRDVVRVKRDRFGKLTICLPDQ